ncbi:ATP-binding cassette domain-containing protein [Nocardiopsis sp. CT-R113]|uniref:ATP-binding cassette domain-containing protein n=1 Tax=Nocardiopsis codii TaxID=3065942 RepID=A0ABU7K9S3_9ACTN|nr:ATP-binding cassette domain-containing protein [Nocardiopsis sp. CT-R113]MEE2038975.1 ATP-binding cassette domain-containing protein [Nocardiopsis sp. CT-R113]
MISTRHLAKSFGDRTLWEDVNLDIRAQQMLALVGPSGSGKTTLLNCLGLLEKASKGDIVHGTKKITRLGARGQRHFRRDHLGYLFQNYALIENATIRQNLDVASKNLAAQTRSLERVGLSGREKEKVHYLSGGEQQRVALARLLVKKPTLVLADEPTGALDEGNGQVVIDILREMAREGCAVVIATHNDTVRDACNAVFDVSSQELSTTT